MTYIPPGFDVAAFAADLFSLGVPLVVVAGVLVTLRIIKKMGGQI